MHFYELLAFLALIGVIAAQKNIYAFVGANNVTNATTKVYFYPDITYDKIIITAADFNCTPSANCTLGSVAKTGSYLNTTFTYYDGMVQIDLLNRPFNESVAFMYVADNSTGFLSNLANYVANLTAGYLNFTSGSANMTTSVLGMSANSTFLNYYSKQNKKNNQQMIVQLDWENNLNFRNAVSQKSTIYTPTYFNANVMLAQNLTVTNKTMKLCISNAVDKFYGGQQTVMAVKASDLAFWTGVANDFYTSSSDYRDQTVYNITFALTNPVNNTSVGAMRYYIDELVADNGTALIRTFDSAFDQARGCDAYTGTLMLKKYNFYYYYVESNQTFDVKYSFDLDSVTNTTNTTNTTIVPITTANQDSGFWWKFLLFVLIFGGIAFAVYYFYFRKQENAFDDNDSYKNLGNQDVDTTELKEMFPPDDNDNRLQPGGVRRDDENPGLTPQYNKPKY